MITRQSHITQSDLLSHRSYVLGRLLSRVFHPTVMNVVTFLIAGYFGLPDHMTGLAWAGLCTLAAFAPLGIFYAIRRRQGAYRDGDVSVRQQRNELYLFGFAWMLAVTLALLRLGIPLPLLAVMLAGLAQGLIGGVVNVFWKISVHSASIAATATVALLYSRELGIALWLCVLAVGWARVHLGRHTPMQVLAGILTAVTVVLAVFQLAGAANIFSL